MKGTTHRAFGSLFVAALAPACGAAFGIPISPAQYVVMTIGGAITGILPDIDHPDASAAHGQVLPYQRKLGFFGAVVGHAIAAPMRIAGSVTRSFMGHRGGTHSLLFGAFWTVGAVPLYFLFAAAVAWFFSLLVQPIDFLAYDPSSVWTWLRETAPRVMPLTMITVALGYLAHIFSDSLNTVPVPWLWPLRSKHAPWIPHGGKQGSNDLIRWYFLPKLLRIRVESWRENIVVLPVTVALLILAVIFNLLLPLMLSVDAAGSASSLDLAKNALLTLR